VVASLGGSNCVRGRPPISSYRSLVRDEGTRLTYRLSEFAEQTQVVKKAEWRGSERAQRSRRGQGTDARCRETAQAIEDARTQGFLRRDGSAALYTFARYAGARMLGIGMSQTMARPVTISTGRSRRQRRVAALQDSYCVRRAPNAARSCNRVAQQCKCPRWITWEESVRVYVFAVP